MSLEITGRIQKFLPQQTGSGRNGTWVKQEFVLETFDQYPKQICISVWGDKVQDLNRYQPGDEIRASINIESREYNERWYTDVRAWRIDPFTNNAAPAPAGGGRGAQAPQSAPAGEYREPANSGGTFNVADDGDLPF